jgi:hypothetical protein
MLFQGLRLVKVHEILEILDLSLAILPDFVVKPGRNVT